MEQQIRRGGADQHTKHGCKDPEGLHPDLEGDDQQHEHDETDRQYGNLTGWIILFQSHLSPHDGIHLF